MEGLVWRRLPRKSIVEAVSGTIPSVAGPDASQLKFSMLFEVKLREIRCVLL